MNPSTAVPLPGQGTQASVWDVALSPTGEEVALIIYSPFPPERGLVLYDAAGHCLNGRFSPPAEEALLTAAYLPGRSKLLASGQVEAASSPPPRDSSHDGNESGIFAYVISRNMQAERRIVPLPGKKIVPLADGETALVSAFGYEGKREPASLHLLDLAQGKTEAIPLDQGIEQGDLAGILPVDRDRVLIAAGGSRNRILSLSPAQKRLQPLSDLPFPPSGLWQSPRGHVYTGHLFHKRLSQFRLEVSNAAGGARLDHLREIRLGQGPAAIAFHPQEPLAFVLAHFTRVVFVLDELEGGKIAEIELKRSPLCLLPREDGLWALWLDLKKWEITRSRLYAG